MVAAFDYCLNGKGGAAPSIDTAMHGLLAATHVDHLHPDSGIALATAADGAALTKQYFGYRVVWVPWRRPGFQLGVDIAANAAENPQASGAFWGPRHHRVGLDQRGMREPVAGDHPDGGSVPRRARPAPAVRAGYPSSGTRRCPAKNGVPALPNSSRSCAVSRPRTSHRSGTSPTATSFDFLAASEHPRLAALGTSCPDHFLPTKVRPMVLDLPPLASVEDSSARLKELHTAYREDYARYYSEHATPTARPCGVQTPRSCSSGVSGCSFGSSKQTAQVAGEFYVNAINVMRGAESVSTYTPIDEREKFRIEYWALEEAKLARMPKPKPLATRIAFVTGAASGIGKAVANGSRPKVPAWSSRTSTRAKRPRRRRRSAAATWRSVSPPTSPTRTTSPPGYARPCSRSAGWTSS
jgi:hypothetical protein